MRKKNHSPSSTYHSRVDNEKTNSSSMLHKCNSCDKKFSSGKPLGGHKRSHRSKLLQPPIKKHGGGNHYDDVKHKHICLFCDKIFPLNKALYGHMRLHSNRNDTYDDQQILSAVRLSKYLPPRSRETKKRCGQSIIDYEAINAAQILCEMSRADPEMLNLSTDIDNQINKKLVTTMKDNNKSLVNTRKKNPSPSSTYHSRVDNEKTNRSSMLQKCNLCDKKFNSGKALGGHKTLHRSKLLQPPIKKHGGGNNYDDVKHKHICLFCDKIFPSNKALYGHMRLHSNRNDTYDDQQILSVVHLSKYSPPRSRETKKRCGQSIIDYEAINAAHILREMSRADPEMLNLSTDIDNQINKKLVTTTKDNNKSLVVRFKFPKDKKIFQTHHEDCN
uniref:Zinc finger protein ZAT1-like n=1 Tax=Cicer arietinum TaxID=3827 RepID=A0A1S3EGW0_CICAR|nr:zinc finger protein ZAT1-like [Cicer arietinum]